MGIFSRIKEKLFGHSEEQSGQITGVESVVTADAAATPASGDSTGKAETQEAADPVLRDEVTATLSGAHSEPTTAKQAGLVDVAAIMDAAVKKNGQKLDWRRSIVDMMKALDLDSSLAARKELADELGFSGDKNDSAAMNIWLHRALMKALSDNGGKVPAELLD